MTILRARMDLVTSRLSFRCTRGLVGFWLLLFLGGNPALWAQQSLVPFELQDSKTTLSIRADSQQRDQNIYRLRGHVEIIYQEAKLTADEATYDESSGEMEARGHVLFIDPRSHLAAEEVHYNVRSKKGWFANPHGFVHAKVQPRRRMLVTENPFYLRAQRIERLDEETYIVEHGRLSSCECEDKGWSLSARRARLEVDHKLVTHDAVFRLLRLPFFYSPFMVNSVAREPRQTGFLLPHIGNSSQKGTILGGGFFWAINPSTDLLFGLEEYSKRGVAQRGQFRARPSQDSELEVIYFGVNDKIFDPTLHTPTGPTVRAAGENVRAVGKADNLGYGFRGVLDVDYINTLAFRLTWSDNFTQAVSSEARQTGFLTKNFDAYSINFYASRYQNFLSTALVPGNSVIIRQTPSASFSGVDKQVGQSPFYFSFEASADAVGRTEPGLEIPTLSERLDFHPEVTFRPKEFWHFHLIPTAGLRVTRYGTSLKPNHDPIDRFLGEFSLDLRPPSFEKVFSGSYAKHRFKHVVEPDIRYQLVRARDPEDISDIVRYDQMDIFAETNEIEYSLTNAVFIRQDVPDGTPDKPQARELLSWRVSQKYYFDPTFGGALVPGQRYVFEPTISLTGFAFAQGRRLSPVVSVLKFSPFSNYDTEMRVDLSPSGGGVLNAGVTSHVRRGPVGLAFTDFFINRTAVFNTPIVPAGTLAQLPSFHLLRAVATYREANRKGFSGAFGVDYNFAQKIAHQVVSQLSYNFGCFGIDFEYRRFVLGSLRRENQFRVALSLANVGTFGNLKPRERLY